MNHKIIKSHLNNIKNEARAQINASFFKTGKGQYSEHDQFLGIRVPELRLLATQYSSLPLEELQFLITSPFNEERLLALLILDKQTDKAKRYQFYMNNIAYVNNWNLVDLSAHNIVGAYLFNQDMDQLYPLAKSSLMWERRIAIVATWYFIRNNYFHHTIEIAQMLLNDHHDLIHKASGWMLREMGKKDQKPLIEFLNHHAAQMPRTMLRYAIERFPQETRRAYLTNSY